eukprot:COSAG03_NODE_224_length_10342_cov_27.072342_1_plen_87_part_00
MCAHLIPPIPVQGGRMREVSLQPSALSSALHFAAAFSAAAFSAAFNFARISTDPLAGDLRQQVDAQAHLVAVHGHDDKNRPRTSAS